MVKVARNALRSWLTIALIAVAFFSMYRMNPNPVKTRDLTQLEFYKAVEAGKIVDPVTRHVDRDEGETYLTGEIETDELTKDGDPVRENYRVALVPGENEGLMDDLLNGNVKVVVKEHRSPFSPFVMQLFFFIGIGDVVQIKKANEDGSVNWSDYSQKS